ncbi:hypothetical protein KCP74_07990 [Salmonella enterica subsp. enterica]|nr:hypothetical protein KCP74_07990 [Salmonella enterica subsp. enterica]
MRQGVTVSSVTGTEVPAAVPASALGYRLRQHNVSKQFNADALTYGVFFAQLQPGGPTDYGQLLRQL